MSFGQQLLVPAYNTLSGLSTAYRDKVNTYSPIVLWQQHDSSGPTATDQSGNGRDALYTNVTFGQSTFLDGNPVNRWDGSTSVVDATASGLLAVFNRDEFSVISWSKVFDASVWSDGKNGNVFIVQSDSPNRFYIRKTSVVPPVEQWRITTDRSGTNSENQILSASDLGWNCLGITCSKSAGAGAGEFRGYLNGSPQTLRVNIDSWINAFVFASIGSSIPVNPALSYNGYICNVAVFNSQLTDADMADLAIVP